MRELNLAKVEGLLGEKQECCAVETFGKSAEEETFDRSVDGLQPLDSKISWV